MRTTLPLRVERGYGCPFSGVGVSEVEGRVGQSGLAVKGFEVVKGGC